MGVLILDDVVYIYLLHANVVSTSLIQAIFNFTVTTEPPANAITYEVWEYMFTTRTPEGWVHGSAGITGVLIFIVLFVMFVLSQPFVRQRGFFEVRIIITKHLKLFFL